MEDNHSRDLSLGMWGHNPHSSESGTKFCFRPKRGIKQIIIRHEDIIDSITFQGAMDGETSGRIGGDGGSRHVKIDIDFPSEYLIGFSGTYGEFWTFGHVIRSLRFRTNRTLYGPYGKEEGCAFSIYPEDCVITGFQGRSLGPFVNAIGVFIEKMRHLVICSCGQRSAGPWGGNGGRDWDDGCFSAVKGVHVRVSSDTGVVCAVRFIYEKRDGSEFVSPLHGDSSSSATSHRKTILFGEEGEFLTGIEGFQGKLEGVGVNISSQTRASTALWVKKTAHTLPPLIVVGRWWVSTEEAALISTPSAFTPSISQESRNSSSFSICNFYFVWIFFYLQLYHSSSRHFV